MAHLKRLMVVIALGVSVLIGVAGCPATQCSDGTYRTRTENGKVIHETCSNGEWVNDPGKKTYPSR